jgi:hypothetical protein
MRRRRFITAAGALTAATLAGCVSNGDDDGSDNGTDNGGDNGTDNGGSNEPVGGPVPDQRADAPPHDPERPSRTDDPDEWNPDWLGEGMATDPSYPFEEVSVSLADPLLDGPLSNNDEYAVRLIASTEKLEAVVDMADAPERLQNVDFAEETVVVVESGYGSSSVQHAWKRVESVDDGLYLHGYHTDPFGGTTDYTSRHSVLVVETPAAEGDVAHVSLTDSEDWRVNFDSSEGVVTAGSDDDGGDNGSDEPVGGPVPGQRVDEPPHNPKQPSRSDDPDDWNPDWMGKGMARTPSYPFEEVSAPLADPLLTDPLSERNEYAVRLVSSEAGLESVVDLDDAPDRLQNVDFTEEMVVVVESGYGSSSVQHAWKRVESVDDGVYLHGYYTDSYEQTDDISPRHSVVVVETPAAEDDIAHVSLTVSADMRVNFDSREGVIMPVEEDR